MHAELPTNSLSLFDHFVGLALKGLKGHFLRNVIAVTDIHMYHTLDNTLDSLIAL